LGKNILTFVSIRVSLKIKKVREEQYNIKRQKEAKNYDYYLVALYHREQMAKPTFIVGLFLY